MDNDMLEIREINKSFQKNNFILQNITCTLSNGLHVLVGPNGSGKSTLLRIAAGIMPPDSGTVLYQEQDIYVRSIWYKYRLGYLPQNFSFYSHMTGMNYLLYLANLKGIFGKCAKQRALYAADLLDISAHCNKKISTWSVGLRQRLGIAQVLLNDPDVLILDEPFYSLAFEESCRIKELIYKLARHKIVLMSSHLIDDIFPASLSLLINGTLCFSGPPDAFIEQAAGYVWSAAVSREYWSNIQKTYPDSTPVFAENTCSFRIISRDKPDLPNIQSVLPSLEEAYHVWLQYLNRNETKR